MNLPTALVLEHRTASPAKDSLVAAELLGPWAEATAGASPPTRFVRLRGSERGLDVPGSVEHVTADGALVANGLLWPERAIGRPLDRHCDEILGAGQSSLTPEVIALNPALFPDLSYDELRAAIERRAPEAAWIEVHESGGRFQAIAAIGGAEKQLIGEWIRDRYGRPVALKSPSLSAAGWHGSDTALAKAEATATTAPGASDEPRIVIIAEPTYQRDVYPALLAAIGDASDALGFTPSIEIATPCNLANRDLHAIIAMADGLILPGGSDLEQVAGQVQLATAALARNVPTIGVCLGMQTMAVAVARSRANLSGADLEEVNPQASVKICTRVHTREGTPDHRLGARKSCIQRQTRLASHYGRHQAVERFNHRYELNQLLFPMLWQAGLRIGAVSPDRRTIDAVECSEHAFYIGLQPHPELSSRCGQPHPLLCAFLRTAAEALPSRSLTQKDGD